MRVRTYGFPGCFTRPPGTSTRHHPHEPTTSKPVVPGDVLQFECTDKRDAVPSHFEEPGGSGPRAFPCGWRGLTPQWPRSLRLGSASGFKVARTLLVCKPHWTLDPAPCAKKLARASVRTRASLAASPGKHRSLLAAPCKHRPQLCAGARREVLATVRQGLEVLPQWELWRTLIYLCPRLRRWYRHLRAGTQAMLRWRATCR